MQLRVKLWKFEHQPSDIYYDEDPTATPSINIKIPPINQFKILFKQGAAKEMFIFLLNKQFIWIIVLFYSSKFKYYKFYIKWFWKYCTSEVVTIDVDALFADLKSFSQLVQAFPTACSLSHNEYCSLRRPVSWDSHYQLETWGSPTGKNAMVR